MLFSGGLTVVAGGATAETGAGVTAATKRGGFAVAVA